VGIPIAYHVVAGGVESFFKAYGPRIRARTLDKWFPPVPVTEPVPVPTPPPTPEK